MRLNGYGFLFSICFLVGCKGGSNGAETSLGPIVAQTEQAQQEISGNSKLCKTFNAKYSAQDNLGLAITNADANCVLQAIEMGADVNGKTKISPQALDIENDLPLLLTLRIKDHKSRVRVIRTLVQNGASVTTKNAQDLTLLDRIIDLKSHSPTLTQTQVAEMLTAALSRHPGIDYVIPSVGERPLAWMLTQGFDIESLNILVKAGANTKLPMATQGALSLLDYALKTNRKENVCLFLLQSGSPVTLVSRDSLITLNRYYPKLNLEIFKTLDAKQHSAFLYQILKDRDFHLIEKIIDANPKIKIKDYPVDTVYELTRYKIQFFNKIVDHLQAPLPTESCSNDPLNSAVSNERTDIVHRLLALGYNPNKADCPTLIYAMGSNGKLKKSFEMIFAQTKFPRDARINSALSRVDSVATFDRLVRAGADINYARSSGTTILDEYITADSGYRAQIAQKLINANAKYSRESVMGLVSTGRNTTYLRTLIKRGADLNINGRSVEKDIPLIFFSANAEVMQILIDAGLSPTVVAPYNVNILQYSVRDSGISAQQIKIILDKLKLLRKYPLDWNLAGDHSGTMLTTIMKTQYLYGGNGDEILKYALEAGANPNTQIYISSEQGNVPLHYVTRASSARILIEAGADKSIKNRANETPYQLYMNKYHRTAQEDIRFLTERIKLLEVQAAKEFNTKQGVSTNTRNEIEHTKKGLKTAQDNLARAEIIGEILR